MEFVETLDSYKFGDFTIVRQVYEDDCEKEIYNVSIECDFNNGLLTKTLDIYETKDEKESSRYYSNLIQTIKNAIYISKD